VLEARVRLAFEPPAAGQGDAQVLEAQGGEVRGGEARIGAREWRESLV
jgi:hypothetical protein